MTSLDLALTGGKREGNRQKEDAMGDRIERAGVSLVEIGTDRAREIMVGKEVRTRLWRKKRKIVMREGDYSIVEGQSFGRIYLRIRVLR